MEDIEDYDERIIHLVKQIEKYIKFSMRDSKTSGKANDGDRTNFLNQIKKNLGFMKEQLNYLKSEIYKIPKD